MAQYETWVEYHRQLATENTIVHHVSDNTEEQTFFVVTLEAFIRMAGARLPGVDRPFVMFIKPIITCDDDTIESERWQFMLFFLQRVDAGDDGQETAANELCRKVAWQWLRRMQKDSVENNEPAFAHSFDKIRNFRLVPYSVEGGANYVGWQLSINQKLPFDQCFNENDWTA